MAERSPFGSFLEISAGLTNLGEKLSGLAKGIQPFLEESRKIGDAESTRIAVKAYFEYLEAELTSAELDIARFKNRAMELSGYMEKGRKNETG